MRSDYRNAKYCKNLDGIQDRKKKVVEAIIKDHPRAVDMHNYIRLNEQKYKKMFIKAYNGKCAYCGASYEIVPKESFEIDHFICREDKRFISKKDAGQIENLILACHTCNHRKSDFLIPENKYSKLHPDLEGITKCFYRDEDYYIRIADDQKNDETVVNFYEKLELGGQLRRLDYLLLSIYGLEKCMRDEEKSPEIYQKIDEMATLLRKKRNLE